MRFTILIILALLLTTYRVEAQLNFTFTESVQDGTLTGEIDGLTLNATSTPTAIYIFTQPAGYPVGPTNLLAAGSGYTFLGADNNFTVNSSGQISGANVGIYKAVTGGYQGYAFDIQATGTPYDGGNGIFITDTAGNIVSSNANQGGFAGVTYTAVPEPRQTMAILLFSGLGLIYGRRFLYRFSRQT